MELVNNVVDAIEFTFSLIGVFATSIFFYEQLNLFLDRRAFKRVVRGYKKDLRDE